MVFCGKVSFFYSLFNVDSYIQFYSYLVILIDNILIKTDGMVFVKNNITQYL